MTITIVDLPDELEQFIRAKMAEGGYQSAEDYIRELLLREAGKTTPEPKASEEEDRDRTERFLNELHHSGILDEPRPIPTQRQADNRRLVEIQGPPLSQTIIEDRR